MENLHEVSFTYISNYGSLDGASNQKKKATVSFIKERLDSARLNSPTELVPDFDTELEWMNTTKPLTLQQDLKGKIVVLDFFTSCCLNCIHILPALKQLENKFKVEDGLVVIGVHTAKFPNEKLSANIEATVRKHGISHAVVNDGENSLWNTFNIRCWPTLLVIGPNREPIVVFEGEENMKLLHYFVTILLQEGIKNDDISKHSLPQIMITNMLVNNKEREQVRFPGKVAANVMADGVLIAISDTGHNRIIITDECGMAKHVIGGFEPGYADGSFETAKFYAPQGLQFYNKDILYVADTENHAIRQIILSTKQVLTLTKNNERKNANDDDKCAISEFCSPWDLCLDVTKRVLIISMAGVHQIWAFFLEPATIFNLRPTCTSTSTTKEANCFAKGTFIKIAGTGKEENRNNVYAHLASFAQPSGLSVCPEPASFFVADSESSTVRRVNLDNGKVETVIGGALNPMDLFAFGDVDACGREAKLQHPLDIAWCAVNKTLFIADSYNHKLKMASTPNFECRTVQLHNFKLNEPSGLCLLRNELLLIADTNNHRIITYDINHHVARTLDLEIPKSVVQVRVPTQENEITINTRGGLLNLRLQIELDACYKLIENSATCWCFEFPNDKYELLEPTSTGQLCNLNSNFNIKIPLGLKDCHLQQIMIKNQLQLCTRDSCVANNIFFLVTVSYHHNAPTSTSLTFNHNITPLAYK